ncbi:hypothetical protein [Cohnella silvisoli]|uniref:YCII-related domain-containing protein n=1 Tax=Cohnella silvisoli TaxID=2873699 RepID=A0ABV1KXG2_9BACL|nr:hypothetical protein [Cohnella silvisoli]MCD9023922.1 hypothetical protein [Cohnella silvisoli]
MRKVVLFCEYVIPDLHRDAFVAWIQSNPERWRGIQLLENTGQPGVYVEIVTVNTVEDAAEIEKERRDGRSWNEMEKWVKGGREGLRIWTFRPVTITGTQASCRTEACN